MPTPAIKFFEYKLPRIPKKDTTFLRALNLASARLTDKLPNLFSKRDGLFFLDLCIKKETMTGVPNLGEECYEDAADDCLHMHMSLYEARYFLFYAMNNSQVIDITSVEIAIYKYLTLYRKFYSKKSELDTWFSYASISKLMFEEDITNGFLWSALFEVLSLKNMTVPCVFVETTAVKMEFMLKVLKKFYTNFECDGYMDLQRLISIDSCLIFGTFKLLKVLLQMGHDRSWEKVESSTSHHSMSFFEYSLPTIDYMKPKYMSRRRFRLLLHIFDYSMNRDSINFYQEFPRMLELLWRAIPDAVITRDEVRTIFEKKLKDKNPRNIHQIFQEWDKMLCNSSPQPRKLQHCTRCVIRRKLNFNFK